MRLRRTLFLLVMLSLFFIVSFCSLRGIITSPGIINVWEWGYPPFSFQFKKLISLWISTWRPVPDLGMCVPSKPGLQFDFILVLFSLCGVEGAEITKIACILIMVLAGISMFYLTAYKLSLSPTSSLVSSFLFMLTPVVFNRIIQGHLHSCFDYALMPLVLGLFMGLFEKRRGFKYILMLSFFTFMALNHITSFFLITLMFILFLLVECISKREIKMLWRGGRFLLIIFVLTALFYSFYTIPIIYQFLSQRASHTISLALGGVPRHLYLPSSHSQLVNTLRLMGFHIPYFFKSAKKFFYWLPVSFLLSMIAFAPVLFASKRKYTAYFITLSIGGVSLASNYNFPFNKIWLWCYKNIPPLITFRDINYWIYLSCVGFAVLIGIFFEHIRHLSLQKMQRLKTASQRLPLRIFCKGFFLVMGVGFVFIYAHPFFTGTFGGWMQTNYYRKEYKQLYQEFSSDPEEYRIYTLPSTQMQAFKGKKYWVQHLFFRYPGKPSICYSREYEPQLVTVLLNSFYSNPTPHLGKILGITNVKYVMFDTIARTIVTDNSWVKDHYPHLRFSNTKLITTLTSQEDITFKDMRGSIKVFENKKFLPHLYPVQNIGVLAADLDAFVSLSYLDKFHFDNNGVVFTSQLDKKQFTDLSNLPGIYYIIQEGKFVDLVFSLIEEKYKIRNLWSFVHAKSKPEKGWSVFMWPWFRWRYQVPLERVVFSFVPSSFSIPYKVGQEGLFKVYLKAYCGPRSTPLKVEVDGTYLGKIATYSEAEAGFYWLSAGQIHLKEGEHHLTITSGEGENLLAGAVIVPKQEMQSATQVLHRLLAKKSLLLFSELNKNRYGEGKMSSPTRGNNVPQQNVVPLSDSSGAKDISLSFPKEGEYEVYIRGWSQDEKGTFTTYYGRDEDQQLLSVREVTEVPSLYFVGKKYFSQGENIFSFTTDDSVCLDKIFLAEKGCLGNERDASLFFDFKKVDYTTYRMHLKTKRPVFLIFSERYHPDWKLTDSSGNTFPSFVGNSYANIFYINRKGELDLALEFEWQKIYKTGLQIFLLSMCFFIGLLAVPSARLTSFVKAFKRKCPGEPVRK